MESSWSSARAHWQSELRTWHQQCFSRDRPALESAWIPSWSLLKPRYGCCQYREPPQIIHVLHGAMLHWTLLEGLVERSNILLLATVAIWSTARDLHNIKDPVSAHAARSTGDSLNAPWHQILDPAWIHDCLFAVGCQRNNKWQAI